MPRHELFNTPLEFSQLLFRSLDFPAEQKRHGVSGTKIQSDSVRIHTCTFQSSFQIAQPIPPLSSSTSPPPSSPPPLLRPVRVGCSCPPAATSCSCSGAAATMMTVSHTNNRLETAALRTEKQFKLYHQHTVVFLWNTLSRDS
jgi:hypothetical protein